MQSCLCDGNDQAVGMKSAAIQDSKYVLSLVGYIGFER
jgi:hypothetical protein